ncbi:DUF3106 domain-containing protein [Rugamonas sp. CCM 8940]|uniref:DUF3106 domain-containing protein n=1 Tax=Rugamonas sp. CCM 8940 TaxID=2765359 RepID=UPI0018F50763|nr:DUF3106 domain-containing protein [Rugamonas sp. CCM 8940]MBJ7310747.1 DUF3106 domain-containing protein [Rugamonas sp. CCM 8940]
MARFSGRAKLGAGFAALAALAVAGASWVSATQPASAPAPAAVAAPAAGPAGGLASASAPVKPVAGGKQHAAVAKPAGKPLWKDLSPVQQQALLPLAAEWNTLEPLRKQKWLEIANRYASMKPDEQGRVQERMREWIKMTPEERRVVRQNFAATQKLVAGQKLVSAGQKAAHWEQYQQLPEEQKKQLAAQAAMKKQVANVPTPAQNKIKTVAPIKAGVTIPPNGGQSIPAPLPATGAAPATQAPNAATPAPTAGTTAAGATPSTAAAPANAVPASTQATPPAPSNVK